MHTSAAILRTMRPKQWTKNLLLFAALIFAKKIAEPASVLQALAAFVLFCALSGAVYLINDVVDAEEDRRHPRKRQRPIASGALSPRLAVAIAVALTVGGLVGCFQLNFGTGLSAAAYTVLTLAYHFALKRMVILDALAVSGGFVLRAVAGAEAIGVVISPWLLMCTLLLALFLSFAKRRQELVLYQNNGADATRRVLMEYTPALLDQLISIVTACTVMSYCLYTISDRTVSEVGSRDLILTIPFVLYGIFRYMYLVHSKGSGEAPDQVLLTDLPLLATVALYVLAVVVVFHMAQGGLGGPILPPEPALPPPS